MEVFHSDLQRARPHAFPSHYAQRSVTSRSFLFTCACAAVLDICTATILGTLLIHIPCMTLLTVCIIINYSSHIMQRWSLDFDRFTLQTSNQPTYLSPGQALSSLVTLVLVVSLVARRQQLIHWVSRNILYVHICHLNLPTSICASHATMVDNDGDDDNL